MSICIHIYIYICVRHIHPFAKHGTYKTARAFTRKIFCGWFHKTMKPPGVLDSYHRRTCCLATRSTFELLNNRTQCSNGTWTTSCTWLLLSCCRRHVAIRGSLRAIRSKEKRNHAHQNNLGATDPPAAAYGLWYLSPMFTARPNRRYAQKPSLRHSLALLELQLRLLELRSAESLMLRSTRLRRGPVAHIQDCSYHLFGFGKLWGYKDIGIGYRTVFISAALPKSHRCTRSKKAQGGDVSNRPVRPGRFALRSN